MSNDVYIVGIDMIRFGRFEDAKPESLAAQAALMALDDCGQGICLLLQRLLIACIGSRPQPERLLLSAELCC